MNIMPTYKAPSVALTAMLILALVALLTGCENSDQPTESTTTQEDIGQQEGSQLPLGNVAEFEDFTIRANVTPTEIVPDAMAQEHGVEIDSDLALLNVVILENRPEQRPEPVTAKLSASYKDLTNRAINIDMRETQANDRVSYIGTLNTSEQRIFDIAIEAQLENNSEPLRMTFEVQLP